MNQGRKSSAPTFIRFRGLKAQAQPVAKLVPDTPPAFANRSLRSRLRLAGRVRRLSPKVVRRSAQREGGRQPVAKLVPNTPPAFAIARCARSQNTRRYRTSLPSSILSPHDR